MYFHFIKYQKIFYSLSIILVGLSIVSIFLFGLKLDIDFTGGSSLELNFKNQVPSLEELRKSLGSLNLGEISIQTIGDKGIILKMKDIGEETHQEILKILASKEAIEEGSESFQSIGPVIGQELKRKIKIVLAI